MRHNLPYNLITDLEMVWFEKQALAVGTMLWLNWFCLIERSLELMDPPNNTGISSAMKVRVDWMNKAPNAANDYSESGILTFKQAVGAIDVELARVHTKFDTHNAEQKKRSWDDAVREKLFTNMQQCFKGAESR